VLRTCYVLISAVITVGVAGCGVTVPQIPEIYDRGDPDATEHMEKQIKYAIFCELREAVTYTRGPLGPHDQYFSDGKPQQDEGTLPLNWGAQVTLTFTIDESTKLAPGVSLKTPMHNAPVNFAGETIGATGALAAVTYGPLSFMQSYAFGLGGVLSSAANRIDTFDTYYSIKELAVFNPDLEICTHPPAIKEFGPQSNSSPFLVRSNLGIKEWLPQAVSSSNFLRSSRIAETGVGPRVPFGNFAADTISYHIKFTVVSSINATPTWNLVRVATTSNPLVDTGRTRTHELLITIGPGADSKGAGSKPAATPRGAPVLSPSSEAFAVHQAQLIGNAVANALRGQ
jgi:hypothetical protein